MGMGWEGELGVEGIHFNNKARRWKVVGGNLNPMVPKTYSLAKRHGYREN